eukprot:1786357-Pleurochrysis_carterae.AAC.1
MYRYDEDVVQPENGMQAYYDPEAAAAQRARWLTLPTSAPLPLAKMNVNTTVTDEMVPEPPSWHPDDLESEPISTP